MNRLAATLATAWLLAASPARAADDCTDLVLGAWQGPVLNASKIETMTTMFTRDPAGHLTGRYHVRDTPPFDGTLTDYRPTGDCEGDFTWTDHFGSGIVHIRFDPDRNRFIGRWGLDQPDPDNIFDGHRDSPPAVS
jgi:hypothetical protein